MRYEWLAGSVGGLSRPCADLLDGPPAPNHTGPAPLLRRAPDESLPSEQEKAVAAKRAVVGLKKPLESPLHGISSAYAPKLDGTAMQTACGESPTVARIMSLRPLSPLWMRQGPARFGDGTE